MFKFINNVKFKSEVVSPLKTKYTLINYEEHP
jgi:hypothetical protein